MKKTDGPKDLNRNEKRTLYRMGLYRMEVPGTPHVGWDEDRWIEWIDVHGEWLGSDEGAKS